MDYLLGCMRTRPSERPRTVGHLSAPSFSSLLGRTEAMKGPFLWPYLLENNEAHFPADSPGGNKYPSVGL